jgi:hypothetical protein
MVNNVELILTRKPVPCYLTIWLVKDLRDRKHVGSPAVASDFRISGAGARQICEGQAAWTRRFSQ